MCVCRTCSSPSHQPPGFFLRMRISWPGARVSCSAPMAVYGAITWAISEQQSRKESVEGWRRKRVKEGGREHRMSRKGDEKISSNKLMKALVQLKLHMIQITAKWPLYSELSVFTHLVSFPDCQFSQDLDPERTRQRP